MSDFQWNRTRTLCAFEKTAFYGRIIAYLVLGTLFLFGFLRGTTSDFVIISVIVAVRSAISYCFLRPSWTTWIGSRTNFLLYLVEISIILRFSSTETSPVFCIYLLLITAYALQAGTPKQVLGVTGLCCSAYMLVVAHEYVTQGIHKEMFGAVFAQFIFLCAGGYFLSIFARYKREQELIMSELSRKFTYADDMAKQILNSLPCPVVVFDEDGFLHATNPPMEKMSGLTTSPALGKHFESLPLRGGSIWSVIRRMKDTQETQAEETVLDAANEKRRFSIRLSQYVIDDKRYYVAVCLETTSQYELEQDLEQCRKQLDNLAQQLRNLYATQSTQATELVKKLGSPLTALLGYFDLMLAEEIGQVTAEQEAALQDCKKTVTNVFRIISEYQGQHPTLEL